MPDENINLAALWVPILPELSHFNEKMREAGELGARHLATGLGGGNVGTSVGAQIGAGLLSGFQRTGVVSQLTGALGGLNLKTLGLATGAAAAVAGFYKLGEAVKTVGQDFEDINANIALFTGKSGPALDDLKAHADALVGTMDTGIKNLGVDMATLSTRLDLEAGPVLDRLTRHVEELRDRFGSLDVDKLTGAFIEMGISGDQADSALASLSQSASEASEPINTLIGDMAKAGPVAKDLGINFEQLGSMLTGIHKHGEDAGAGVDLLQRAQKAAKGENFAQFLQREVDIIDQYRQSGNLAAAEEEAYLLSGTRKWEEFTDAGREYLRVLREGPDAHKANGDKIDDQLTATKKLHNEWTQLINELKVDLKFPGDETIGALTGLLQAMEKVLGWFDSHPSGPQSGDRWPVDMSGMPGDFPGTSGTGTAGGGPSGTGPGSGSSGGPFGGFSGPGGGSFGLDTGAPTIGSNPAGGGGQVGGSGTDWDAVMQHEAGGSGGWKANTGNGFYGGLQFDQPTWDAYKPPGAPARADLATREQQIAAGENRLNAPGGAATGWPKTFHDHPELFGHPGGTGGAAASPGGGPGFDTGSGAVGGAGGAGAAGFTTGAPGSYGLPVGTDIRAGKGGFPPWVYALGEKFGLVSQTYAGHQEGSGQNRGIDFYPAGSPIDMSGKSYSPEQVSRLEAFAKFLQTVPGIGAGGTGPAGGFTGMEIFQNPMTGEQIGSYGGAPDTSHQIYADARSAPGQGYGGHQGHVHLTTNFPIGADGSGDPIQAYTVGTGSHGGPGGTPGSGGSPFIPGTGETEAQARARQRAVENAQERQSNIADYIKDLEQQQKDADDARKTATAARDKLIPGAQGYDEQQKEVAKDEKELARITKELTHQRRELVRAGEDLTEAQTRQGEESSKAPPSSAGGKGGAYGAAEQLGAGLLSGIGESLGFPDIFGGKPPWEFGSVKLGLGALGWGLGFANRHGMLGGGGPGGAAPGGVPGGLGAGLGGALGLPGLPGIGGALQGGAPNPSGLNPDGSTGPSFGGPGNPIPAGTVSAFTHIDNRMIVNGTPPKEIAAAKGLQLQNAGNALTVAAPGAVPA